MAAIAGSAAVGGAAVAFFMDIDQGRRRRALARQRLAATARRVVGRGGRAARYLGSAAAGAARRVPHPRSAQQPRPMTSRSCRKIETEIFRGADMPKPRSM